MNALLDNARTRIRAHIDNTPAFDVIHIESEDRLTDAQIQYFLEHGVVDSDFIDWVGDIEYLGMKHVAREISDIISAHLREDPDADEDEFDILDLENMIAVEFATDICDKDATDPWTQLARQTTRVNASFLLANVPAEHARPDTGEELLSRLGLPPTARNFNSAKDILDCTTAYTTLVPRVLLFAPADIVFAVNKGATFTSAHLSFNTDGSAVAEFDLHHDIVPGSGTVDSFGRNHMNVFATDAFDGAVFATKN